MAATVSLNRQVPDQRRLTTYTVTLVYPPELRPAQRNFIRESVRAASPLDAIRALQNDAEEWTGIRAGRFVPVEASVAYSPGSVSDREAAEAV